MLICHLMGAWPRWWREQTRLSELCRLGPSKGFAAPFFAAPGPPGKLRGIERRRTPRERAGLPSGESYGGVGPCGLGSAGDRRPRHVADEPRGAAGCAAVSRHPHAMRRLPGLTSEQRRSMNLAAEVPDAGRGCSRSLWPTVPISLRARCGLEVPDATWHSTAY
ncbi:hypothetical protein NDU88_000659 [Pleurodeles waltl]|uniref:Uncharacterized protein n=1 Tax=Pleurodeles waltl TaxID=8319 RepID=A0AAV7SX07_PLEWA|nr:hypothetical protein NDU88_000659 [Pleurodeles waltl]